MAVIMSILFLSVDVVLVIKNPFYPKEWRVRMLYIPVTLLVSLVYMIIMMNLRDPTDVEQQRNLDSISDFIIYSLFTLISLTSIVYSYQLLLRPGINRSMRV